MKKYITILLILLTVIFTITACDSNKYYCKNCDAEVTVNEAIIVDYIPTCEECGHHSVYKK
jgi:DNA-directed RNA polymerase subunit RPC12/RpoP